jgi:amino acid permease
MKGGGSFKTAAIVAAAAVGDGIFALPYVFYQAGWLVSLFYLVVLGAFVSAAHVVYLETLEKLGEKERLLGLARRYLGAPGFWAGFIAIVVGLLLTLVAYLILGTQFVRLALPAAPSTVGFLIFWLFVSLPVFLDDRHVVDLELVGIVCTAAIIILIFASAWPNVVFAGVPAVNSKNLFLPFGAVLFALAGWTSVEPAYESRKRSGSTSDPWRALAVGTFFVAVLYVMFASGILGSAPAISPDTASGLAAWPVWKKEILAVFGLIAVATVYLPVSREIKNSLEKDLRWNRFAARSLIVLAPPALVWLGLNNFLVVVGLVGGLFLSSQYLLIISVGRRALALSPVKRFLLDLAAGVFAIAAVYELWTFIVH